MRAYVTRRQQVKKGMKNRQGYNKNRKKEGQSVHQRGMYNDSEKGKERRGTIRKMNVAQDEEVRRVEENRTLMRHVAKAF